jgi:anti-sigma regulatory factor (Ser/Thr protein kinase)
MTRWTAKAIRPAVPGRRPAADFPQLSAGRTRMTRWRDPASVRVMAPRQSASHGPLGPQSPRDVALDLPRDASAGAAARHELRCALRNDLDPSRLADVELVVSELVTNALVHGRGAIKLRLRIDRNRVRGEVVDQGSGFEGEARMRGPDELSGRGLFIVNALTTRWGVHEGTTHVWFEIDSSSRSAESSGPALGEARRPPELPPP